MSESCEWGYDYCQNIGTKCYLCSTDGLHLLKPKERSYGLKKNTGKVTDTGRQGASSETKSYNQMKQALNTTDVAGTPNSGAGRVKGDFQIRGLINIMEELKTTVKKNLNKEPGKESFTIQRAWLDKLWKEAKAEKMEFQYLKFSFKEHDDDFYCVTQDSVILNMIVTMKHDRIELKKVQSEFDIYKKRAALADAENTKLRAELELAKAELEYYKNKDKEDL